MTATPVSGSTFFGLDVSGLGDDVQSLARRISRSTLLIEFGPRMLQLAEARPRSHGISLRHLTRIELPEGALDRFVPADPVVMAQLIRDECKEKRIFAHRAAVVLPPELAFQRIVHLPQSLSTSEAREFLLDPSSGIQLPFPLEQTDFDITPLGIERLGTSVGSQRLYQLTAIPATLVGPVLSMLDLSGFDLQSLELGSVSSLRCIKDELMQLPPGSGCLVLDFLSEATLVTLVSSSGPIDSERLPSIREFPQFELVEAAREQVLDRSRSLEDVTVENEGYLPISEMDLRAFEHDFEPIVASFQKRFPEIVLKEVHLMGESSAHPVLPSLLQEKLKLPVKQCRPLLTKGLRDWTMDEPLLQARLSRLVGLSLGLLDHDSSTETDVPFVDAVLDLQNDSVNSVIDDARSRLDTIDVSFSDDVNPSSSLSVEQIETQLNVEKELIKGADGADMVVNQDLKEESQWPSLKLDSSEALVEKEKVIDEMKELIKGADSADMALNQDLKEESQWPSLKLDSSEALVEKEKVIDEMKELIKGADGADMALNQDLKEESQWPSLKLDLSEELAEEKKGLISTESQESSQKTNSEPADSPLGKLRFKSDSP